ncbi:MAG TPA: dihydrodipicolinate synthase family protein [Armatimonadota bacterium]|nr:dihydrodipicolinate synthase family protein [Armatimonadota bacterium]
MSDYPGGVWSAAPTPFTDDWALDLASVHRMVAHHVRLGISGLFLAGTNGEGPWMPAADTRRLTRAVVQAVAGRMPVAVQVTDNSAARIIENMRAAYEDGADIAVIAPPFFLLNATAKNILALYRHAIGASPLPVGIYDRGHAGAVVVPDAALNALYAEKKVVLVKDSAAHAERMAIALEAKRRRPGLTLLNGWEFNCVPYLRAGYDGLLLGGGAFNGYLARRIIDAVRDGKFTDADRLQRRMNRLMYDVYGGKAIACWLAGEKRLLQAMGVFTTWKNYLHYPLTAACERAIQRALVRERDVLLPAGDAHG